MTRSVSLAALAVLVLAGAAVFPRPAADARDRPFDTTDLVAIKLAPNRDVLDLSSAVSGNAGSKLSKNQIERFRCESSGDPSETVDMSCNDGAFGQNFAPDNEIAIAVDPEDPEHLVAGSNDYFYRFNNSTGGRQAIVPTGFFTSFDGGETWIDGQIPMRSGNGAGDPSPAFDGRHDVVMMAQLENLGGQGSGNVSQGDVSVSRSTDGGITWSEPVTVFKGTGTGIGPANQATFYDKEWLTVDNHAASPHYGRAYLTTTRFLNGPHGSYAESPIYISYSDDGGLTWSKEKEISGSHDSCSYQETGGGNDCDEDQFSIPEVAPNGDVYVHYLNGQNEEDWEVESDFDSQLMVVKSTDGGASFGDPVPVVQLEDGLSDMPWSVIGRQTVWGHQIRWTAIGTISVDPTDADHIEIVFADRGTANPNAIDDCFLDDAGGLNIGEAPYYDPCGAGPGSDTDVYVVESNDGGDTWGPRQQISEPGHAWFPWADHTPDGTLAIAWDQDDGAAPADTFHHVLKIGGGAIEPLGDAEHIDVSVTHWAGQYTLSWPAACGPDGYSDGSIADAEGKDCNVFHGDYTGLAVGSDGSVNVVWTGLNRVAVSPQVDFYLGEPHDGYAQDAMFARR